MASFTSQKGQQSLSSWENEVRTLAPRSHRDTPDITRELFVFWIRFISPTWKYEINICLLESIVESLENAGSVHEDGNEKTDDDENSKMYRIMKHCPESKVQEPSKCYKKSNNSDYIENLPQNDPNFLATKITQEPPFIRSLIQWPKKKKISCNIKPATRHHQIQIRSVKTTADNPCSSDDYSQP